MCVFLFTCPQVGGVHIVLAKGAENKKETPLALCALVPKLRLHLERGGLSDFFFFFLPLFSLGRRVLAVHSPSVCRRGRTCRAHLRLFDDSARSKTRFMISFSKVVESLKKKKKHLCAFNSPDATRYTRAIN